MLWTCVWSASMPLIWAEFQPWPGTKQLWPRAVAMGQSCRETCAWTASITWDKLVIGRKCVDSSGVMTTCSLHPAATTINSWSGSCTQANRWWDSISTRRRSRLSAGVRTSRAYSRLEAEQQIGTFASGIRWLSSPFLRLTRGVRCATWCSAEIHKKLSPLTVIRRIKSFYGNSLQCRK